MNRSIILIICDFLLISLLALARFDMPEEIAAQETLEAKAADKAADQDLIEVLELSLQTEQESQSDLSTKLVDIRQSLDESEEAARLLAEEKRSLEQQREKLIQSIDETQAQLISAEKTRGNMADDLATAREESAFSRERVRLLQERLIARKESLEKARLKIVETAQHSDALEREKQHLFTELQIRQTEKQMLEQNLVAAKAELDTVRVEKQVIQEQTSRLAEGFYQLAETSTIMQEEISREIRLSRPLSLNAIFSAYQDNRVEAWFKADIGARRGRVYPFNTIFVTDGSGTYALFHVRETPFRIDGSTGRIENAGGSMNIGAQQYEITEVSFLAIDPRILMVRVPPSAARQANIKIFSLASDPLRFPEAVLIGHAEGYYGETTFKLDPSRKHYLQMQSKLMSRLFGEFSPSRGDLVFAKTGEFMGLMVDKQQSVVIDALIPAASLPLGSDFRSDQAATVLASLRNRIAP